MNKKTNIVLLSLLLGGLAIFWGAEWLKVPTSKDQRRSQGLAVPSLASVEPDNIVKLEIRAGTDKPTLLTRTKSESWNLAQPVSALARGPQVEALIRNLKKLQPLPESGKLEIDAEKVGLSPPSKTMTLFDAKDQIIAEIELGKTVRDDEQYIRVDGVVRVVDANYFKNVLAAWPIWRERTLFSLATSSIDSISVAGQDRSLQIDRIGASNVWEIRKPIGAVGDEFKIEGLMADLVNLGVPDRQSDDFVANDVQDFSPYGLDKPWLTIELKPIKGETQKAVIGNEKPDRPGHRFARRLDQDDVILIDCTKIDKVGLASTWGEYRNRRLFLLNALNVDYVEIEDEEAKIKHVLARNKDTKDRSEAWQVIKPIQTSADPQAVVAFLKAISEAQTLNFLDPTKVTNSGLNQPGMTIKIWENSEAKTQTPASPPKVELKLGRFDAIRKAVYATVAGDSTVLAIGESIRDVLPTGELAFLDRTVLNLTNEKFVKITLNAKNPGDPSQGKQITLSKDPKAPHWSMNEPIVAPAHDESIQKLTIVLSRLRAKKMISRAKTAEELAARGLDTPQVVVGWRLESNIEGRLLIGKPIAQGERDRFAKLQDNEAVFVLDAEVLSLINTEFRDHQIFRLQPEEILSCELRWETATAQLERPNAKSPWSPKPGTKLPPSLDISKIDPLIKAVANLKTERFYQYQGTIPPNAELNPPHLTIKLGLTGNRAVQLRLGNRIVEGRIATIEDGAQGAAFALSGPAWSEWVAISPRPELPADVFAPAK